jgi:dTDP-4-dehydrorhamnose 3,5-epimerase-like enzyme
MYNDSDLNIDWGLKTVDILLSDRNTKSKTFMEFVKLNGLTK